MKYNLHGWKAISKYMGIPERTLRRYRETHKLPVFCLGERSVVRASTYELDQWMRRHNIHRSADDLRTRWL